ncbi:MAG: AraC family transcriptional regulator [Pseudomonadota bacterium]
MTNDRDTYTDARLAEAGKSAGYTDTSSNRAAAALDPNPMFKGRLSYESFSTGVSVYFSDMISLTESGHEGLLDRSWTLAINLGNDDQRLGFGEKNELVIQPAAAKVVTVSDQVRTTNHVKRGYRGRSLLLRLAPGIVSDGELAEVIERATAGTEFCQACMTTRLSYLATCLSEPRSTSPVDRLLAESRALELIAHVLGQTQMVEDENFNGLSHQDRSAVKRVRDLIHEMPNRDFTLLELANEAGMSLSSLKAKFPIAFNETVFGYLRGVRLDYAREQISQNGWTVTQAAHFVGYRHVGNFSKAFRRRFGVNPKDMN